MIDKKLLKEIILEQNEILNKKDIGIAREIILDIKKSLKIPQCVVITGMRRVGKSTLMLQLMKEFYQDKCYYFNFEDERLVNFKSEDFNGLYEILIELYGKRRVFFFDEIQNVAGWENFVRRMQDQNFKFFLTGSNASMLSRELGTKLTGRYMAYELYPFSFQEYLTFQGYKLGKNDLFYTAKRAKIKMWFGKYLKTGGMPEYLKYKNNEVLKRIYEDILYRDIVTRYDLKAVKSLRELALYYFSNIANLISYNKLKDILSLGSVNTVKSFTEYFENSFLFFPINIFSYKITQQFIAAKKIYSIDNGLTNNVAFNFSQNQGNYLENLVFLELKRRKQEIYYYKSSKGREIDFILRKSRKVSEVIQVCDNIDDHETKLREIKAIKDAFGELKVNMATILTDSQKEIIKEGKNKIFILPVYEWLIEK